MPKLLWCINVYSRLNHLRLQEALIRKHFGNGIDLLVFSNHEKNKSDVLHFMEDHLHIHPTNSGGHTGCQDAYNEGLRYLKPEHKFIIWSHADCILSDYSFIEETLEEMQANNSVFSALEGVTRRTNPRRGDFTDVQPYVLNDLMIFRPDFYQRVFPRYEVLDGLIQNSDGTNTMAPYGVEVAVGRWVNGVIGKHETIHAMGRNVQHHQIANDLGSNSAMAHMNNNFDRAVAFVEYMYDAETVGWLHEHRVLTRNFDDRRFGPGYDDPLAE
jgi:hypothetical protein